MTNIAVNREALALGKQQFQKSQPRIEEKKRPHPRLHHLLPKKLQLQSANPQEIQKNKEKAEVLQMLLHLILGITTIFQAITLMYLLRSLPLLQVVATKKHQVTFLPKIIMNRKKNQSQSQNERKKKISLNLQLRNLNHLHSQNQRLQRKKKDQREILQN